MKRFPFHLLLSLLLVLPFAACDSDGDDDGNGNGNGDIGDADVTISGDVEGSFSGNAYFVDDSNEDVDFAIGLFSGSITTPNTGQIVVLGLDGDRPDEGTYEIGADEDDTTLSGVYLDYTDGATSATLVIAQSGTLTISSSSSDRVVGTFTFTGQATSGGAGSLGTATVTGSFTAEFIEDVTVPTTP